MKKPFLLLLILMLLLTAIPATALADGHAQDDIACESIVTVQLNDWLSKISDKFYADVLAYPAIVEATNAKAAGDDAFTVIDNPSLIEPGWQLCIPTLSDAKVPLNGTTFNATAPQANSTLNSPDIVQLATPKLLIPENDASFSSVNPPKFNWSVANIQLGENDYYVLIITRAGNVVDYTWLKNADYNLGKTKGWMIDVGPDFTWQIVVARATSSDPNESQESPARQELSEYSNIRSFRWADDRGDGGDMPFHGGPGIGGPGGCTPGGDCTPHRESLQTSTGAH